MKGFESLELKAYLKQMGYQPFEVKGNYLHSLLTHTQASFQNKDSDPFIISLKSFDCEPLKVWNFKLLDITEPLDWTDLTETIKFKANLYINNDGFLINLDETNLNSLTSYKNENIFLRQIIKGIDERLDLGNLMFIVSDAGILFSIYEKAKLKTLKSYNQINIFENTHSLKRNMAITFEVKSVQIGEYKAPFSISAVHVMPTGSLFNSKNYKDWE